VCPVAEDKLLMKLLFKKEQVQNKGSFMLHLNVYLEIQEGILCLVFLFNVEMPQELLRNHTHISTNSVQIKYRYK
jgi:hypothetical protein